LNFVSNQKNDGNVTTTNNNADVVYCLLQFEVTQFRSTNVTILPIISLPIAIEIARPEIVSDKHVGSNNANAAALVNSYNDDLHLHDPSLQVSCIRPINIHIPSSVSSSSLPILTDGETVVQEIVGETNNHTVTVYAFESPGLLGIGGKIWDSNFVLLSYLSHCHVDWIEGKTIIELGSGPGAAGKQHLFCIFSFPSSSELS